MPITIHPDPGAVTITLSGEIDHHGARTMMQELEEDISTLLPRNLTLDLSGITFMDSSGIAVLLRVQRQISHLGGTLRVTSIPTQPRKVLDAAGVGRLTTSEEGGVHSENNRSGHNYLYIPLRLRGPCSPPLP